jgi:hypothetical protein
MLPKYILQEKPFLVQAAGAHLLVQQTGCRVGEGILEIHLLAIFGSK